MLSRQLAGALFLSILVCGYSPHFVSFSNNKYNMFEEGEFSGRVSGWSSPPFASGLPSEVVLELENSGNTAANGVEVQLRYTDLGVGATTWFDVDTQLVDLPPGEKVKVSFFPVFKNRAQVSLEASFVVSPSMDAGPDSGEKLADRMTAGFERLACDSACSFTVPMRNDREEDLTTDLRVLCLLEGAETPEPCPTANNVQLVSAPASIPGESEVLLEIDMDLAEGEALTVVVQERSDASNLNEVAVSVIRASAVELLNSPMLCCISSVRLRAGLGAYLAAALSALEKGDAGATIAYLRFFLQRAAALTSAAPSEEEQRCLEKAMHLVSSAARVIAKDQTSTSPASLVEGDMLRRGGHHAAAALVWSRGAPFERKELQGRLIHWPDSSLVGDSAGRDWLNLHKWTHVSISHRANDLLLSQGDGSVTLSGEEVQALKRKLGKKAREHVRKATHSMMAAVSGTSTYDNQGDLQMIEAGRSMLEAAGEVLEGQEESTQTAWEALVSESMSLSGYDNPVFVGQTDAQNNVINARRNQENPTFVAVAGAQTSVVQGRVRYDGGSSVDEVQGAVLESVMRINAFARRVRRARAQAVSAKAKEYKARRDAATRQAEPQAQQPAASKPTRRSLSNDVDQDCTGREDLEAVWSASEWPPVQDPVPTPALDALMECVKANLGENAGEEEEVVEESERLVELLRAPLGIMSREAVALLESEAQRTKEAEESTHCAQPAEKKVGLCCRDARRAEEGGASKLSSLLALHERVLDLMHDAPYWVELARDASREGGGFLTSSTTTMSDAAVARNPRVVGGTFWYSEENGGAAEEEQALAMTTTSKVKTWKRDTEADDGCGPEGRCECDTMSDAEGECVMADPAAEPTACQCRWVANDWNNEVPEWSTVVVSVEVTSRRRGQPLRSLSQDIRVEVQASKNDDGRRAFIGKESDGIHQSTYESSSRISATTSTTLRTGNQVSLVAFGTFRRKGRAKRRYTMPDPKFATLRRAARTPSLDHVGAYNFMVEISGIDSLDYGTSQGQTAEACETFEDVEVFEYDEEAALTFAATLGQPQPISRVGSDSSGASCVLGNPHFQASELAGTMIVP